MLWIESAAQAILSASGRTFHLDFMHALRVPERQLPPFFLIEEDRLCLNAWWWTAGLLIRSVPAR